MAAVFLPLSTGVLASIKENGTAPLVLQVKSIDTSGTKVKGSLADGTGTALHFVLASQVSQLATDGMLNVGARVKVTEYMYNVIQDNKSMIVITGMEVLSSGSPDMQVDASANVTLSTPKAKGGPNSALPSPSDEPATKFAKTPSGAKATTPGGSSAPTPPTSFAPVGISTKTRGFAKVNDLNPYRGEDWCLKAKVERKGALRTINTKNGSTSILNVELVDDEGKRIQGTFWRQQADRYADAMAEGRVYVFSHFTVRMANRQYASVNNDYEITFTDKTDVSEAADQSEGAVMKAVLDITPIDQLPRFLTRKAPVDVVGVVTLLGAVGTVKRKSDQTEVIRRDVTIADQSCKSVVLTIWGSENVDRASALEGREGVVLQVSACKVGDYNGCSLSSLAKSELTIDPDTPEAGVLQAWWAREGSSTTITPVGAELPGARTPGAGAAGAVSKRNAVHSLKEVTSQPVPDLEARPTYHNILAVVANINPEQAMTYMANPENGRKVTESGGVYADAGGAVVDKPVTRYMVNMKLMDASGDMYLMFLSEQGESVMGMPAEELAALKVDNHDAYKAKCQAAQFCEWALTLSTRAREYQGDRKLKHSVINVRPINYITDGQRLVDLINRY